MSAAVATATAVGMVVGATEAVAAQTSQTSTYHVHLTGHQVVDAFGDPDAIGTAMITVFHKTEQVCVDIDTTNLAVPTENYYIAVGGAGEGGGAILMIISVDVRNPDPSSCFVSNASGYTFKQLWRLIEDHPEGFYLQVHNWEHGDGAIRGQLALVG
jgi:hypothetical protein